MARKIAVIREYLVDTLVSKAAAIGITIKPNLWSKYDYKRLILDTVATGQGTEEQLWDAYKSEVKTISDRSAAETPLWFQYQVLNKFQFDSANPQIVGIYPPNFSPSYGANENDALKIIKYCTAASTTFGRLQIKAAAQVGGLPADVDTTYGAGTLDTLQSFVNTISDTTIVKVVTSGLADRLFMQMDVYYNGLYAAVIQVNILTAIKTFLANIPFDGVFLLSQLELAILAVTGVNDIVWVNMKARPNIVAFGGGTEMVTSYTTISRLFSTVAGYIISEDTVGSTLIDPRPLTPSINNLNLIAQ